LQFEVGALNIKSISGLLILGGQELFWICIPPMLFCFFGTCQRESPLTQSSLHIFLGLEYLQYDVTHHLFSNGIISQELGWWFQTLHKAARVSPEHMARSRVGYGENMLRGCRKSWFMMFPSYLVIYTIKSINQTLHFVSLPF
jgi:hypothetical protein